MELERKLLHGNSKEDKGILSITLDDNYNIPNESPDVDMVLREDASIDNVITKAEEGRVNVSATFTFSVLYLSRDRASLVNNVQGTIPIKEWVNIEAFGEADYQDTNFVIEDLNVKLINSRKLSVRAIVTICVKGSSITTKEVVTDAYVEGEKLTEKMVVGELAVCKKDNIRLHQECVISSSKPDVESVIYREATLMQRDIRIIDGGFSVKGDINIFIIYTGENKEDICWYEALIPFDELVSVSGMTEEMLERIEVDMTSYVLEVKPDEDGLQRKLALEATLDFKIFAYEEEELTFLTDVYNPAKEYVVTSTPMELSRVLLKNASKCQINEGIGHNLSMGKLLQLIHVSGNVLVDDTRIVENGIEVNGIINVWNTGVMADDERPLEIVKGQVPFTHIIEAKGITEECEYIFNAYVDKISASIGADGEIGIRANVTFNTVVIEKLSKDIITEIIEEETDKAQLAKLPGIVGYITKEGDTLWNIAKKYKTTQKDIMELNGIGQDGLHPGKKIIIVKKVSKC